MKKLVEWLTITTCLLQIVDIIKHWKYHLTLSHRLGVFVSRHLLKLVIIQSPQFK